MTFTQTLAKARTCALAVPAGRGREAYMRAVLKSLGRDYVNEEADAGTPAVTAIANALAFAAECLHGREAEAFEDGAISAFAEVSLAPPPAEVLGEPPAEV